MGVQRRAGGRNGKQRGAEGSSVEQCGAVWSSVELCGAAGSSGWGAMTSNGERWGATWALGSRREQQGQWRAARSSGQQSGAMRSSGGNGERLGSAGGSGGNGEQWAAMGSNGEQWGASHGDQLHAIENSREQQGAAKSICDHFESTAGTRWERTASISGAVRANREQSGAVGLAKNSATVGEHAAGSRRELGATLESFGSTSGAVRISREWPGAVPEHSNRSFGAVQEQSGAVSSGLGTALRERVGASGPLLEGFGSGAIQEQFRNTLPL